MKLKKRNFLLAAILISFIMAAISFEAKVFETERIIIDNTMSKVDIERLQETLKEKDISLTFSDLNYNTKGLLQSVKGSMKGGVNFFSSSGTFSANNLDKIIIVKGILGIEIQVFSERKS
jgi:hypothetical protein